MNTSDTFCIWEGIYPSFQAADGEAIGPGFDGEAYHSRAIVSAQECLAAVNQGRPIPPFHKQRSAMLPPIVAMMLENAKRVRILDWGGGLGIGYLTLLESLSDALERIDYTIVEVPGICHAGRELFAHRVAFLEALPENGRYDLVHSSSALQYVEDWRQMLRVLSGYGAPYLLLSDVYAGPIPTFVTLQNYYGSRIKHWFLNLSEFVEAIAELGYRVQMRSYVTSRRLRSYDILPMDNFPSSHRLDQTLHLLLRRSA